MFIDCPPSLGILTLNALAAVDEVFLPLQPHFLALHGLSKLLQTIDLVAKRLNDRLKLSGVVYCMYESGTRLAAEVADDVEQFFSETAAAAHPLGRSPHVPDPHPPQHSPGRGPQLRPVDLPLRPRLQRGRGLRATGPRSGRRLVATAHRASRSYRICRPSVDRGQPAASAIWRQASHDTACPRLATGCRGGDCRRVIPAVGAAHARSPSPRRSWPSGGRTACRHGRQPLPGGTTLDRGRYASGACRPCGLPTALADFTGDAPSTRQAAMLRRSMRSIRKARRRSEKISARQAQSSNCARARLTMGCSEVKGLSLVEWTPRVDGFREVSDWTRPETSAPAATGGARGRGSQDRKESVR